ncbi:MAG: ATP-dependent helicase [Ilumatobacter coccineus]|uniref:ATP-dependent helicase n=1 Tax=Ilumatobacter coccineus TaxID=467094 RepID=A0A2G6KA28_9ACTN|nr:MAG: ATP-dependent helicase [Ilumatobacter coccineus]
MKVMGFSIKVTFTFCQESIDATKPRSRLEQEIVENIRNATGWYQCERAGADTTGARAEPSMAVSVTSMTRDRPEIIAQGIWRSRSLYVWGWDGERPASVAWLYRGPLGDVLDAEGSVSPIMIELPDGGSRTVPAARLGAMTAISWLDDLAHDVLSPSLAWFRTLAGHARHLILAGRLLPTLIESEGEARWSLALTAADHDVIAYAASLAPAICLNGSHVSTADLVGIFADAIARTGLEGWSPDLDGGDRVLGRVMAALSQPDARLRGSSTLGGLDLGSLDRQFIRYRGRLIDQPVRWPRLRLHLPLDALDPWRLELELVDDADPGRWCTADQVARRAPEAVEIAGHAGGCGLLDDEIAAAITTLASQVPGCAAMAPDDPNAGETSGVVEFDLDSAQDFLDEAPEMLERLGIDLLGPEHLVTAPVKIAARVRSAPRDESLSRFGKEALVEWSATVDDTEVSLAEIARAETMGTTLMRSGHRWVRLDRDGLRRARTVISDHDITNRRMSPIELVQLVGDLDPDIDLITESGVDPDDDWVARLTGDLGDDHLREVTESPGFDGTLRSYQRRGLSWLQFLGRAGLGGCLADDMGLGKTATALAYLFDRPGPHLVVCPLSVVHNWESEARRFTPSQSVMIHHGSGRQSGEPALIGLDDHDLVITTYGLLPRDLDTLGAVEWTTVVFDEAQMIKNPATKAARAARSLTAAQKVALTGTPVENRLSELWSILDVCNPGLLGSRTQFRQRFARPIENHHDETAAATLRALTQPFILRRTKADRSLIPDLPDKIEQIAYASLTSEQATLYQEVVNQLLIDADQFEGMQRRGRVLTALLRLKQICNHPAQALKDGSRLAGRSGKLNRCDELIDGIVDLDERALIFTQFREMGELLADHLGQRWGIDAPFLHGGVSRPRRDRMIADYQSGVGPPLLIISLKAGGTGLNLTAANHVIHYDRWWNPAVEDQATDRAWRIGQDKTVNVHKLVCTGTVEEKIGQLIDDKRAIADAVVGRGEAWLSELTTDQLASLVTLEGRG